MGCAEREPRYWVEDTTWHRRMFGQSMFRWAPEDPMVIALNYTRGRLTFDTAGHLRFLDQQGLAIRDFAGRIDDVIAAHIREGIRTGGERLAQDCLSIIDVSPLDAAMLEFGASSVGRVLPEVVRVQRDVPLPNPFTLVWELRQLRSMYTAADHLIEDAYCDLALELHDEGAGLSWSRLAQVTPTCYDGDTVKTRVQAQRAARGHPGDLRRTPEQRY